LKRGSEEKGFGVVRVLEQPEVTLCYSEAHSMHDEERGSHITTLQTVALLHASSDIM
jgi:hypothetical protein